MFMPSSALSFCLHLTYPFPWSARTREFDPLINNSIVNSPASDPYANLSMLDPFANLTILMEQRLSINDSAARYSQPSSGPPPSTQHPPSFERGSNVAVNVTVQISPGRDGDGAQRSSEPEQRQQQSVRLETIRAALAQAQAAERSATPSPRAARPAASRYAATPGRPRRGAALPWDSSSEFVFASGSKY